MKLMLTLEKFRLEIVSSLLTVVGRPHSVIAVRWRGGGEVVAFRRQGWPMGNITCWQKFVRSKSH